VVKRSDTDAKPYWWTKEAKLILPDQMRTIKKKVEQKLRGAEQQSRISTRRTSGRNVQNVRYVCASNSMHVDPKQKRRQICISLLSTEH